MPPRRRVPYKNPLRSIANLTASRIDQGVDYGGTGPIYALGPGQIVATNRSGWPGGAYIAELITAGPASGKIWYEAEDITPRVHIGQTVNADTVVGDMWGPIEIGWGASGANLGESLALSTGQWNNFNSTAYGVAANNLLVDLGAPSGITHPPVQGTVPRGYQFPGKGSIDWNPIHWVTGPVTHAVGGITARITTDVEHLAIVVPLVIAAAAVGVLGLFLMTKGPRHAIEERTEQANDRLAERAGQAAQVAAVAA